MPSFRKALRNFSLAVLCASGSSILAQSPTAQAPASSPVHERDHVKEREEWFRSGRKARGETSADLLQRAYTQKLRLRAAREKAQRDAAAAQREGGQAQRESAATPNFSNLTWQSLGPTPMIFDP